MDASELEIPIPTQPASLLLWSSPSSHVVLFLPSAPGDCEMMEPWRRSSDDWIANGMVNSSILVGFFPLSFITIHPFSKSGVAIQVLGYVFAIGSGMTNSMVWKVKNPTKIDWTMTHIVKLTGEIVFSWGRISLPQSRKGWSVDNEIIPTIIYR